MVAQAPKALAMVLLYVLPIPLEGEVLVAGLNTNSTLSIPDSPVTSMIAYCPPVSNSCAFASSCGMYVPTTQYLISGRLSYSVLVCCPYYREPCDRLKHELLTYLVVRAYRGSRIHKAQPYPRRRKVTRRFLLKLHITARPQHWHLDRQYGKKLFPCLPSPLLGKGSHVRQSRLNAAF